MLYEGYRIIKTTIQQYHKYPSKIINGLVPFPPNPENDTSRGVELHQVWCSRRATDSASAWSKCRVLGPKAGFMHKCSSQLDEFPIVNLNVLPQRDLHMEIEITITREISYGKQSSCKKNKRAQCLRQTKRIYSL